MLEIMVVILCIIGALLVSCCLSKILEHKLFSEYHDLPILQNPPVPDSVWFTGVHEDGYIPERAEVCYDMKRIGLVIGDGSKRCVKDLPLIQHIDMEEYKRIYDKPRDT